MSEELETMHYVYIFVGVMAVMLAMVTIDRSVGEDLGISVPHLVALAYFIGSVLWIVRSSRKQRFEAPVRQAGTTTAGPGRRASRGAGPRGRRQS